MGGVVSLGYRVENRALHVVKDHAAFVRDIFRRYLEIGAVVPLKAALIRTTSGCLFERMEPAKAQAGASSAAGTAPST